MMLQFIKRRTQQAAATNQNVPPPKRTRTDVFVEQVTDSGIVAGIAGLSTYVASDPMTATHAGVIAFGLTFLVKLKEYRGLQS